MSLDVSTYTGGARERLFAEILCAYRARNEYRDLGDDSLAQRAEERMNWLLDLLPTTTASSNPPMCPSPRAPENG